MAHSKRNTSRPVFTSYERAMANAAWSTSKARLTRESFLPLGSCCLCLEISRDPVSCHHGDIFCRECALANILTQKKEMKRLQKAQETAQRELQLAQADHEAQIQERAVKEFEMIQAGLRQSSSKPERSGGVGSSTDAARHGTKRKFNLDADELDRIANEDRAKAKKTMEEEKAQKPVLASFWTPSLTPSIDPNIALAESKKKGAPRCPASPADKPHLLSQKHLISVEFTEDKDPQTKEARRICPCCLKALSNASRPLLSRACGHVLCRGCIVRLLKPAGGQSQPISDLTCYVCDKSLASESTFELKDDKGKVKIPTSLIEMRSEGTGFSAGGANKVEKSGTAFQC